MGLLAFLFFISHGVLVHAFDWQGHRGARGLVPENTIEAMEEALKYPVTTLELDVVVSADHKLIVSHDPYVEPEICNVAQRKNIYKLSAAAVSAFDCGSRSLEKFPDQKKQAGHKPLLEKLILGVEEKLKNDNRTPVSYNVEIKSTPEAEKAGAQPGYEKFSDLTVETLLKNLLKERFTIQSFDPRVLKYIHAKYPQIKLSALYPDGVTPQEVLKLLGFTPNVFSPAYQTLTPQQVAFIHSLGSTVIPWTVNTAAEMRALIAMGVDGIITDYPNLITAVKDSSCPSKQHYFQRKCITVPSHSTPIETNPGWVCNPGYVQKRNSCIKIKIPDNSHLLEDGKTWVCDPGFERYRGLCNKSSF
ncbi:MAG TPA: glycerophosphodiester phosphodiesterase family protein [Bacteriovoracaceae bacterium]|nr:glycerophosphodiester phosphodiesterase family protein [Bacteriovoracaceae bacterium]